MIDAGETVPGYETWLSCHKVPFDARCLDGHFPDDPLVPGAYLLALSAAMAAAHCCDIVALKRVKFIKPVRPGCEIELRIKLKRGETALSAQAVWRVADDIVADAKLKLKHIERANDIR